MSIIDELQPELKRICGQKSDRILFIAEFAEGMKGGALYYSVNSKNFTDTIKLRGLLKMLESEREKLENSEALWTSLLLILQKNRKPHIEYFNLDFKEGTLRDCMHELEEKYFPNMKFIAER